MLYFVPAPIGNLGDISARTLEILKEASVVICEDTRVSKALLDQLRQRYHVEFGIKRFVCLNSHNASSTLARLNQDDLMQAVYLSDAGMPCISDPGSELVNHAIKLNVEYSVLPGASASLCALCASGFSDKEFYFHGFLNIKKQRQSELEELLSKSCAVVLYEAPSRISSLIDDIASLQPQRTLHLVKEISKLHERHFHASAQQLSQELKNANLKGEWVVVISPNPEAVASGGICAKDIIELPLPIRAKAKLLSKLNGKSVKQNYEELQEK